MTRTFLVDGTALAYRAHFAFTGRGGGLTTSTGHPTSATFGFIMTMRALFDREKPQKVAIAFDGPREALERTKIYPEYKATRDKAPEELVMQFEDMREVVHAWGLPILELAGQEADDVIGTLAVECRDRGDEVFLVTGDKDFMQLIDDSRIRLYDLMSKGSSEPKILGPEDVVKKFGVGPEQMVDLLALMGDSSDNVPGVPGVGAKTAARLLKQYGTLENLYEHLDEITKPKLRANLEENRDKAFLSKQLVTIRTNLALPLGPDDLGPPQFDSAALLKLYRRLEFRALADGLLKAQQEKEQRKDRDYRVIQSLEEVEELAARLREAGCFAFDTETTSLDQGELEVVGMSFSFHANQGFYVPLIAPDLPPGHDKDKWLAVLKPLLEDPGLGKIGQNLKYDIEAMQSLGVEVRGLVFDTMLASYCVAPGIRRHNLDELSLRYFNYRKIPTKELIGTGKKKLTMDQISQVIVGEYACEDADFTYRLKKPLEEEIEEYDVREVFYDIELPLVQVLVDMETRGIKVDRETLKKLSEEMDARIQELTARIYELAGEEFNIQSPAQLGKILFEKLQVQHELGLKKLSKTKTGQYRTDASVLESLGAHPMGALLLEYRKLTKLKGTYVDALPKLIRPETGRIHTSFNQAVASTGRLSSDNPNLQNIPIRTEEGRKIRGAFVAGAPDWVLISSDYSQIELRILAHLSRDENLIEGFQKGEDVHRRTAALVFDVMPALVTSDMRSHAKVINYGLVYGMGAKRLANETGMSVAQAKKFIEAYFKKMPRVKDWLDATLEHAREDGEVRTLFGRRRPIPEINSQVPRLRVAAENVAVNSPIQGTAADIIKIAMIRLHKALREHKLQGRQLLQVHDELVLECPKSELDPTIALVRDCMENAAQLEVPLTVDIGTGHSWLQAHQ
ncbi:MAG TPA: DNA polymerase I [Planctomycetes bacterium]|nr:DNA polymerase I [Planctomycetota bacterium]